VFSMFHSDNSFPDLDEGGLLPLTFDDTLLKGVLLKQVKTLSSSLDAFELILERNLQVEPVYL
jgi:hypothetical protein